MKNNRLLLLITVFSFLLLPCNILAAETINVVFITNFESGVDKALIPGISIMMDDSGANSYDNIALTRDNDYRYELQGLLNGNLKINDMFVLNDNSGKYSLKYEQTRKSSNEIEIRVIVSLSAPKENTTTIKVNDAVLGDIFGDKYVEKSTQVIPSYGTEEGYVPPDKPLDDGTNQSTTTNNTNSSGGASVTTTNEYGQTENDLEEISKRFEESKKEIQKQEEIEKRNNIYTIILIIIIIIIIIAIIFITIKFANANK